MGRISGGQQVQIFGSKLSPGNISVFFIYGNNNAKQATAIYISDTELNLITPEFSGLGAREVDVRIRIGEDELSTNPLNFTIYLDTKADKTIFFGPGCLESGGVAGIPTSFLIRAKNELNENRSSGLDNFVVNIFSQSYSELEVPVVITDLKNGTYKVEFTAPNHPNIKLHSCSRKTKKLLISENHQFTLLSMERILLAMM
jgi:dynein heavy chain